MEPLKTGGNLGGNRANHRSDPRNPRVNTAPAPAPTPTPPKAPRSRRPMPRPLNYKTNSLTTKPIYRRLSFANALSLMAVASLKSRLAERKVPFSRLIITMLGPWPLTARAFCLRALRRLRIIMAIMAASSKSRRKVRKAPLPPGWILLKESPSSPCLNLRLFGCWQSGLPHS